MFPYRRTETTARSTRSSFRSSVVALLLLFLALAVGAEPSIAKDATTRAPNASAESLTSTLVAMNARHQLAGLGRGAHTLNDLLDVAASRQQFLASLIEENPGEVLRIAMPATLRAGLPPAVQDFVEEEAEGRGDAGDPARGPQPWEPLSLFS